MEKIYNQSFITYSSFVALLVSATVSLAGKPLKMNSLLIRTAALLLHAAANFLLITYLLNFDITAKWISFFGFVILALVLLFVFVRHLISYIYFLKTKTK